MAVLNVVRMAGCRKEGVWGSGARFVWTTPSPAAPTPPPPGCTWADQHAHQRRTVAMTTMIEEEEEAVAMVSKEFFLPAFLFFWQMMSS